MKLIEVNHNPTRRQLVVFGIIWLAAFALAGRIALNQTGSAVIATVVWCMAIGVPAIGWAWPEFLRIVYIGLAYATMPIGFVVSCLLMAVIYYLMITPMGLLKRMVGGDPIRRRFDRSAETYWRPREQDDRPARYFRQF